MYKYVQYKAIHTLLYYKESEVAVLEDDSCLKAYSFHSVIFSYSCANKVLGTCGMTFKNKYDSMTNPKQKACSLGNIIERALLI